MEAQSREVSCGMSSKHRFGILRLVMGMNGKSYENLDSNSAALTVPCGVRTIQVRLLHLVVCVVWRVILLSRL